MNTSDLVLGPEPDWRDPAITGAVYGKSERSERPLC
jgi:hypothetical protein